MSVAVRARGLDKAYRDGEARVEVLRGLDLDVGPGEIVAVVGPSGSGKSTLLHLLGALDRPDGGEIAIDGTDVGRLPADALADFRRRYLGFVFQFHELLPDFTAVENVMMPGRIAGWDRARANRRAAALLAEAGLEARSDHYPNELSGGERQRVALCRALCLEPPLLLADEPTGNLDPASGERMFGLLLDLRRRHGTTALVATHNMAIAAACERVLRLDHGRLEPADGIEPS
ncbi:MAG: ABC transporter ATP-binding protein [Thermoanaerobaculia bacterium]|nr:ABC transporter ATP-binding protein [Thermoanaerobaculia bacterium]